MNRVCFFSGVPIDDSATFFRSGAAALQLMKMGYGISFLSVSANFKKEKEQILDGLNIIFVGQGHYKAQKKFSARKRLGALFLFIENLKTCFRFGRFLLKNKPDCVFIITTMPVSLLAGFTSKVLGFKTLIDIEDYGLGQMKMSGYSDFKIYLYKTIEGFFLRFFDRIVVPSTYLQKKYQGSYLLPNMVNIPFWKKKKKNKGKKIVFVGQMGNYHGQLEVLKSFFPILKKNKNFKLIFIGGGEEKSKIKDQILKSKIKDQLEITGYVSQKIVRKILLESEVGILPLWETPVHMARHPLKMLEYMACGLTVVANSVGEAENMIKNEVNGVLCPKGDMDCLAKSAEKMIKNPNLSARIAQRASNSVKNFSYEKIMPKWIEVINL